MQCSDLNLQKNQIQKLLGAANADAALLYLYIQSGNDPEHAERELRMSASRYTSAAAVLRQMDLWPHMRKPVIQVGERPHYSENDVIHAVHSDGDFRSLYGEVQRNLGKSLNTEELKILLGFVRYLGMSPDVVVMLVSYCKERARRKGNLRNPSLRTIEKEAYAWAELGIETLEEAAAHIQEQNLRQSRLSRLMELLQIRGRNLTPGEEKYAKQWLDWGMEEEVISMAYERTCLNTGGLSWAYMNKILTRWHESGLHTAQQVRTGDTKNQKTRTRSLDEDERAALERLMQEG